MRQSTYTYRIIFTAAFACMAVGCSNDEGSGGESGNRPGGAECTDHDQCTSGTCVDGRCTEACPGGICIIPDVGTYEGGTRSIDSDEADDRRDAACAAWGGEAEPESAIVMFLVDVSSSMKQPDPSNTTQTKWQVTGPVLEEAIAGLPGSMAVGLLLYPNMQTVPSEVDRSPTECVNTEPLVPVELLGGADSEQRTAINAALAMTPPDNSGTPTHDAIKLALDALGDTSLSGSRYLVLLTDGQPTYAEHCVGDGLPEHAVETEPIIEEVADALGDSVSTFVIGAPGSEETVKTEEDARPWLSMAAEAGGTMRGNCSHDEPPYCHYDMVEEASFADGLTKALLDITEQVIPCDYGLPAPPAGSHLDKNEVDVILTSSTDESILLLRDDSPDCTEGWRWSEDSSRVLLCPDSCVALRQDIGATLDVLFQCTDTGVIK